MRILVVEDDSLVANGIKQGLTNAGYTVDVAKTAAGAERYLLGENFDLAIVDIGLPDTELQHDQLMLNTSSHTATLHGKPLLLTRREWAILEILLLESPKVVSKDKLLQNLTGWDKNITPNAIEVHVSRLRAKIEPGGIEIRTVRGIGYRIDQSHS